MKVFSVTLKEYLKRIDYFLLSSAVLMTLLSVLTLASGMDRFGYKRPMIQAGAMAVGVLALLIVSVIDVMPILKRLTIPLFVISVAAIGLVILIGTGASAGTWFKFEKIGLSLQPSEFVKVFFLITFSRHLEAVKDHINRFVNVIGLCIHGGAIFGLVTVSGDLGSGLVFAFMMILMMYIAGLSLWYFAAAGVLVTVALPIIWGFLDDYQRERIVYGFNPELDPVYWGFQALSSKRGIIAGGLRGTGFSGGTYYLITPAAQSDMLFSVLAEKFGFFGTGGYLLLLMLLFSRLLHAMRTVNDCFGRYLIAGVAAMIMSQALENIGMCLAVLPVVGITLPFFSYGGSSILSMFLCLGLVENIITHNEKFFFER